MKKILLTVVLGVAVVAVGQDAAHPAQGQSATPAQGQPAASQSSGPVIKDPAEYNAYVAAVQQKDANAKISGLEAFLTQYPSSVMKNQALEILMQTYQAANNAKKTMETATKLVTTAPICPASQSAKDLRVMATRQQAGLASTRTAHALMSPKNR